MERVIYDKLQSVARANELTNYAEMGALVGHKKGESVDDPGKGFYEYARELRVYTGGDDLGFWATEVKWLHEYWSSH